MTRMFSSTNYYKFLQRGMLRGAKRVMVSPNWMRDMMAWSVENLQYKSGNFPVTMMFGLRVEVYDFGDDTVMELRYD